jgi:hypothetical protein
MLFLPSDRLPDQASGLVSGNTVCCYVIGSADPEFKAGGAAGSRRQMPGTAGPPAPGRRLAHHDHGRPHEAPVERVALLHHGQDRVRLRVGVLDHAHGLMHLRVEGLTGRIDGLDVELAQCIEEAFQGQLDALGNRFYGLIVARGGFERPLEVIDDRQQL